MKTKLKTRIVSKNSHIRAFFDEIAENYQEAHGKRDRLLSFRLSIIHQLLGTHRGTLLEIGCGTGIHLFQLAEFYEHAIGTDLSPKMIKVALQLRNKLPEKDIINFYTDPAEELTSIGNREIDTVICVGTFEHLTDKQKVLEQINRVLKPGGEFICLTLNGCYCWYINISHWLKMDTKHLSSDHFLTLKEIVQLVKKTGLITQKTGYWTFIPRGDMPEVVYGILNVLDYCGKLLKISAFRGGIYFKVVKPSAPKYPTDG